MPYEQRPFVHAEFVLGVPHDLRVETKPNEPGSRCKGFPSTVPKLNLSGLGSKPAKDSRKSRISTNFRRPQQSNTFSLRPATARVYVQRRKRTDSECHVIARGATSARHVRQTKSRFSSYFTSDRPPPDPHFDRVFAWNGLPAPPKSAHASGKTPLSSRLKARAIHSAPSSESSAFCNFTCTSGNTNSSIDVRSSGGVNSALNSDSRQLKRSPEGIADGKHCNSESDKRQSATPESDQSLLPMWSPRRGAVSWKALQKVCGRQANTWDDVLGGLPSEFGDLVLETKDTERKAKDDENATEPYTGGGRETELSYKININDEEKRSGAHDSTRRRRYKQLRVNVPSNTSKATTIASTGKSESNWYVVPHDKLDEVTGTRSCAWEEINAASAAQVRSEKAWTYGLHGDHIQMYPTSPNLNVDTRETSPNWIAEENFRADARGQGLVLLKRIGSSGSNDIMDNFKQVVQKASASKDSSNTLKSFTNGHSTGTSRPPVWKRFKGAWSVTRGVKKEAVAFETREGWSVLDSSEDEFDSESSSRVIVDPPKTQSSTHKFLKRESISVLDSPLMSSTPLSSDDQASKVFVIPTASVDHASSPSVSSISSQLSSPVVSPAASLAASPPPHTAPMKVASTVSLADVLTEAAAEASKKLSRRSDGSSAIKILLRALPQGWSEEATWQNFVPTSDPSERVAAAVALCQLSRAVRRRGDVSLAAQIAAAAYAADSTSADATWMALRCAQLIKDWPKCILNLKRLGVQAVIKVAEKQVHPRDLSPLKGSSGQELKSVVDDCAWWDENSCIVDGKLSTNALSSVCMEVWSRIGSKSPLNEAMMLLRALIARVGEHSTLHALQAVCHFELSEWNEGSYIFQILLGEGGFGSFISLLTSKLEGHKAWERAVEEEARILLWYMVSMRSHLCLEDLERASCAMNTLAGHMERAGDVTLIPKAYSLKQLTRLAVCDRRITQSQELRSRYVGVLKCIENFRAAGSPTKLKKPKLSSIYGAREDAGLAAQMCCCVGENLEEIVQDSSECVSSGEANDFLAILQRQLLSIYSRKRRSGKFYTILASDSVHHGIHTVSQESEYWGGPSGFCTEYGVLPCSDHVCALAARAYEAAALHAQAHEVLGESAGLESNQLENTALQPMKMWLRGASMWERLLKPPCFAPWMPNFLIPVAAVEGVARCYMQSHHKYSYYRTKKAVSRAMHLDPTSSTGWLTLAHCTRRESANTSERLCLTSLRCAASAAAVTFERSASNGSSNLDLCTAGRLFLVTAITGAIDGALDKALRLFATAVSAHPSAEAYHWEATTHFVKRNFAQAITSAAAGCSIQSSRSASEKASVAMCWYIRGAAQLHLDRVQTSGEGASTRSSPEAQQCFEAALKLEPRNPVLIVGSAACALEAGFLGEAVAASSMVLDMAGVGHELRASALSVRIHACKQGAVLPAPHSLKKDLGALRFERAYLLSSSAAVPARDFSGNFTSRVERGTSFAALGCWSAALKEWQIHLDSHPLDYKTLFLRAVAHHLHGYTLSALEDYTSVIKLTTCEKGGDAVLYESSAQFNRILAAAAEGRADLVLADYCAVSGIEREDSSALSHIDFQGSGLSVRHHQAAAAAAALTDCPSLAAAAEQAAHALEDLDSQTI